MVLCHDTGSNLVFNEFDESAITIGYDRHKQPVTAGDLEVAGAMTVLLKNALKPSCFESVRVFACPVCEAAVG